MINKTNSKLSFLCHNLKGCPEKLKQTFLWFAHLWSMAPLFGTHTKNTTVIKLGGCSVELQGSSKVGIQDTLVFLICLMCWGGCLNGDRRLDLFCYTKSVWHKCPSKVSLLRYIRVLEENTTWNLDRLAIQLANMDSRFFLKLLVHGTTLLSLKLRHWLYLDQIFFNN